LQPSLGICLEQYRLRTCDGLDNDCAGGVDNGLAFSTYYRDADGDGAGDPAVTTSACSQPSGYVPVAGDGCPQDGLKTAPGVCGCGTADADSDSDGRIDCMDLEVVMTAHEPFIAHDRPYIVRVSALAITAVNQMTGMQLAARFDASRLELLDVVPVENGPFSLEVGEDINNASGSLRYAVGVNPGDSGVVGSTALVDLVFAVRPEADLCRQDVQLAWLQNVGSWRTLFVTATSAGATPSLVSLPFTDLDTTDPVLAGVPTNVAIATDAGSTFGAFVAAPIVTATDDGYGLAGRRHVPESERPRSSGARRIPSATPARRRGRWWWRTTICLMSRWSSRAACRGLRRERFG